LRADTARHPGQAEIVSKIKTNPGGSFFLAGRFGCGKTHMMWALYRDAVMHDRRTVACALSTLMGEYKRLIELSQAGQTLQYPRIAAETLRQTNTKYSIFLDDLDKARPTEYVTEQVFELIDAAYAYQHQLVVTTNLSVGKLIEHFDRADARFGGAIVRRLVEGATVVEMF
jgi:DNA replication protein DnaC